MKLKITLDKLKNIIDIAEENIMMNDSNSRTIEIQLVSANDSHCGNDTVVVRQKSVHSECDSTLIGY